LFANLRRPLVPFSERVCPNKASSLVRRGSTRDSRSQLLIIPRNILKETVWSVAWKLNYPGFLVTLRLSFEERDYFTFVVFGRKLVRMMSSLQLV